MSSNETRSSYWDNLKLILIFLVVVGHYFGSGFVYRDLSGDQWAVPRAIFGVIYMFHMPLFAFVSGFFSKNVEKARNTAISQLLLPYVLFNTLCVVMNKLIHQVPLVNPVFEPYNHMWYLFALFLWRYTAIDMIKLRFSWLWTLGFALFCFMFAPGMDDLLISRAIMFWPFFLAGLLLREEQILRVKQLPKWLCGLVVVAFLLFGILLVGKYDISQFRMCFYPRSFGHNLQGLIDWGKTVMRYLTAAVLGICVLNLTPSRKCFLTDIGQNTMTILLLHSLPGLRNVMNALNPFPENVVLYMLWYLTWAVVATGLFGNRYVLKGYRVLMNWISGLIPVKK